MAVLICAMTMIATENPVLDGDSRAELVQRVFNEYDGTNPELLDRLYSNDVKFEDPLGRIEGLDTLKRYYAEIYEGVDSVEFTFQKVIREDDDYVLTWNMTIVARKLNGGDPVSLEGNSIFHFNEDGKVDEHRDYFDMGEMVYEHIPILGFFVRKAKQRLQLEEQSE